MAIDKIKLRRLVKDKDERFFEEGDILDALNVVTSAYDGIDGGVVKNVRGTLFGTPVSESDRIPNEESRVVGSVSDNARGYVYFFVWSTTASNHGIYQYYPPNNTYRLVLRNSILAFEKHGFVNADLINGEFETDSTQQTILYFTDNVNPPRKINVDRVLFNTDLGSYSNEEISELISVIKTPPLFAPEISLTTDVNRTTNNLYGTVFQFATQYVYKDGESSAISPHSKVVYPKYMSIQGIESPNITQDDIREDNLALINTRWTNSPVDLSVHKKEVDKLKILVRTLNTGAWRVVDEFNPNENLIKANVVVYNSESGIYNFYNEGIYISESISTTDKIYDDVPQKATSQAIVGNRLMYSSPTAGYPNVSASATFTVTYLPETDVELINNETSEDTVEHQQEVVANAYDGWVRIDTSGLPNSVEANSEISISFRYQPTSFVQWGYYNPGNLPFGTSADLPLLKIRLANTTGNITSLYCGEIADSSSISTSDAYNNSVFQGGIQVATNPESLQYRQLDASIITTEELSKSDYMDLLIDEIKQQILSYEFRGNDSSDLITWKLRSSNSGGGDITHTLTTRKLDFDVSFPVCNYDSNTNYLTLEPRAGNFFIPTGALQDDASAPLSLSDEHARVIPVDTPLVPFEGTLESVAPDYYEANSNFLQPRTVNGILLGYVFDRWDDYVLGPPQENGMLEMYLSILPLSIRRTFKAGSTHEFGVVYFDKHGRPGYVNELGSVYVQPFGNITPRSDGATPTPTYYNGPCNINVTMTSEPPEWAVAYQIVYAGTGSWEKFESYTVGGAFSRTENDVIYVSLNTLAGFQSEKGALKDYAYTPGDKLRVINYMQHPTAGSEPTQKTYLDDEYIFDIVGYETYVDDQNWENHSTSSHTNHVGKFLLLSNIGGPNYEDANFDNSDDNYWSHQTLVEILTPRKNIADKVYYEVGEARRIFKDNELSSPSNNAHNDGAAIVLTEGDVYYRPCSLKVPNYSSSSPHDFIVNDLTNWYYISRNIESLSASDFFESKCWSKGRAHVTYDRADTINYYNRIVYSDEMGDDIGGLTFSSFNPGALSYKNLPKNYGAIKYIGNYNQSVAVLQENKLSYIPVQRNVIEYADGDSSITVGREVMGQHQESNGDFGCGSDQSSVLLRDGILFFVDRSRRKVLAAAGGQLKAISDIDMSSYFEGEIDSVTAASGEGGRIITGYDPEEDMLFFTIEPKKYSSSITYPGTTVGYSVGENAWISRYSFVPSNYATIDNTLLSCKWHQNLAQTNSYLFNKHTNQKKNTFYGEEFNTEVEVISKISPSEVKVFNAISYEGSSSNWIMPAGATTDLGQTSGVVDSWSQKEGSYYSVMPKDVAYKYVYIGTISSNGINIGSGLVQLDDITRLDRFPFKLNSELIFWYDGLAYNELAPSGTVLSYDLSLKQITTSELTSSEANGKKLFFRLSTDGNAMRGHWMRVKISNDSVLSHELYCINTHIADSKSHHPKGQQ